MKAEANYYHDTVLKEMELLRSYADAAEELIGEDYLPYPTYASCFTASTIKGRPGEADNAKKRIR
mgnify:FL=1